MRLGRIGLVLFSVFLVAVITYAGLRETAAEVPLEQVFVQVKTHGNVEDICVWEDEQGQYFVFLPGYAQMDQIFLMPGESAAAIDGVSISEGTSCRDFELNKRYLFSCIRNGVRTDSTLTFVQASDIPAVYIDVHSGNMDYIHEEKGNEESGSVRVYTNDGELDHKGSLEFIKGRGNATWGKSKKPYNIKLSSGADLLGMGHAEKWILLANDYDDANLRNKIGLDLAEKSGMSYTPDCQWVDLYLNGEYAGLYLLSERNEVHENRVDISHTDSFLVSIEMEERLVKQAYPFVVTNGGNFFRVHHSSMSESALKEHLQSIENAILAEDGTDAVSGKKLEELIDIDSWAMRMLVDEIMANYDGGSISQFFYYDPESGDDRVKAGPVWDMDNTLAFTNDAFREPNVIAAHREHLLLDTDVPLYGFLYQKSVFRNRVSELYRNTFRPILEETVYTGIPQYARFISDSSGMNQIRWNKTDPGMETERIQRYLEQRMLFLNEYWLGSAEYHLVYYVPMKSVWMCIAVRSGDTASEVIDSTKKWHRIGTNDEFDLSQPIYEDVTLVEENVNFEAIKEYFANNHQDAEEVEPERLSLQSAVPLMMFLMFLAVVFIIDIMRSDAWKRRGKRKNDIS